MKRLFSRPAGVLIRAMAAVAQWQSSRLWSERSWVQIPSVAPDWMGVILMVGLWLAPGSGRAEVTVFAAASLTEVLESIARGYEGEIRISVAASSVLARQIEAGAQPDIFISAHPIWMDRVERLGLIEAQTRLSLLGNTLVIVTASPTERVPRPFTCLSHWLTVLGSQGRIAIGDPDHVPAGLYAQEALIYAGLWNDLKDRLARAENVRGALNWVIRRETPLGIVYASDVRDRVTVLGRFPPYSYTPIEYPMAILSGQSSQAVRTFYRFLQSPELRVVYQAHGFTLLFGQ